ncbi:MAG: hypothetical protein WC872_03810 [Candidatus Absconditabacterales bacterium]
MVFKKNSSVSVETKKMLNSECCGEVRGKFIGHLCFKILLLINTIILILLLIGQYQNSVERTESMKVGGMENYKLIKQIYGSDTFKSQQKQQIQQALQMYQGQAQGAIQPTAEQPMAEQPTINTDNEQQIQLPTNK